MRFIVQPDRRSVSAQEHPGAVLVPDSWNDYGYRTSYDLWYCPEGLRPYKLGRFKIARGDQETGPSALAPGEYEDEIPRAGAIDWYSLGQDDLYYEGIRKLGDEVREQILVGLWDIAFSLDRFAEAQEHHVVRTSLLRGIDPKTVRNQYHRIATGGARLTEFRFHYHFPTASAQPGPADRPRKSLTFEVEPNSAPPSNIHVLIGRNGVGKTSMLRELAWLALRPQHQDQQGFGRIEYLPTSTAPAGEPFVNVLSVSFSAFDAFRDLTSAGPGYTYVGLVDETAEGPRPKERGQLTKEFLDSLSEIAAAGRFARWRECVSMLHQDRHLPEFLTSDLVDSDPKFPAVIDERKIQYLAHEFSQLSAGHAIVLLTLARLVQMVAEQSLVLIDEPEAHLHPPLLSAFVRALSNLLSERNGVAVVATHSPVVLQEVPRACVYKLIRSGERRRARRPSIETYGENVGVLTHEIFGLEVMESGFYAEIEKAVADLDSYDEVLARFHDQLGGEARGLVRILLATKEAEGDDA
ncbi:AAA family ATPase [Streptomyces sp. NPDC051976]|uniref:AAA family ATPase n=1 Tax=Streptomyces sp. NPDC051976 TaxID=3154947 RepID=UPI00341C47A4